MKKITLLLIALMCFTLGQSQNPATGSSVPTSLSADVLSVYSDTYTSNATNLNPSWGQATVMTEIDIDGNKAMKYANLNYQGIEYTSSDVSAMEYVHLDYYTADATAFQFFLIAGGENAYDVAATDGITTGEWVSIDIPLSFFSDAGRDLTAAIQFKIVGNNNLFLDNLYFWKEPAATGTDTSLSDLTVDGTTITGFSSSSSSYSIELPAGTVSVPTLVATTTDGDATSVITNATSLPGDSTILVTAQDGTTTNTVTVSFSIDPTPTAAALVPTSLPADVISVYSDTYTSNATNLNPGWGQATVMTEIDIDGNKAMKYANLNYQGLEYASSDVSEMGYLHLDYYTADATAFQFFLIAGGENAYDVAATDGITTGEWVSIDIPLSFFSDAGRDLTAAIQFKIVGNNNLFLDNLYFWKEPAATGTDTSLSDLTVDGTTITGFSSSSSSYSIELPAGTVSVPTLVATTTDGDATSVITNATSLPGDSTILVTAQDGTTTNTVTVSFSFPIDPTPTVAAPAPTDLEADVISVYSDTYTSNATNLNPGWGQATVMTEIDIDGNKAIKYANLNYQGLEYASSDVSAMGYLHLDYYTADATAFELFLIAGGENAYNVAATDGITTGEWVGVDIPLSFFSEAGRDLTAAIQFKIVGNNTLYLDNLYFHGTAVVVSNDCSGASSEAEQGSFTADYSYGFETLTNGDVRLTAAMPSGTEGLVAYAWKKEPFAETAMTVTGTEATIDVSGYTTGDNISYAVKFAWAAGGFGVTKYFTYTVGEDCATASTGKNNALNASLYPNPTSNTLNISAQSTINTAAIYNILGKQVMRLKINKNSESIDVSGLSSGIYLIRYTSGDAIGTAKFIKE